MAEGKEMNKLLGKSPRKETSPSIVPMETQLTTGGVDLGLVMDGISLSQDFELWFGKSIFESILAEVIQKKYRHAAVTLIDVLELMVAVYCPDIIGVRKEQMDPQQTYEEFYHHIYNHRCYKNDADWEAFRQRLSFNIATSCERLRNEKVSELHGVSLSTPPRDSMVSTPATDPRSRASSSSSSSSFSSSSSSTPSPSPVSSRQQYSDEGLPETSRTAQALQPQTLQPQANPAPAPRVAVDMPRYTSVLNEHATLQADVLTYEKRQLSILPSSWQCTAVFGNFSAVGVGRNATLAKHVASKQICEMIGLSVF